MTVSGFESAEDLLEFVKSIAHHLSELGFGEATSELTDWWSTAYTTSSEFLGQLGLVCDRIIQRDGARLPACLTEDLQRCLTARRAAFRK